RRHTRSDRDWSSDVCSSDLHALTAGELAAVAGVTPQTTSSHLSKLVERRLLAVERRGPRRFYRLATPLIAQMLEGMMTVAASGRSEERRVGKECRWGWLRGA